MLPILPRQLLWNDLSAVVHFFRVRPGHDGEFHVVFSDGESIMETDPLNIEFYATIRYDLPDETLFFMEKKSDQNWIFNEVYYQVTKMLYEHPKSVDFDRYFAEIKADTGWHNSTLLVLTMVYFMIALIKEPIDPVDPYFMKTIKKAVVNEPYWAPFDRLYYRLSKDNKHITYPFKPNPVPVQKLRATYMDWERITCHFNKSCIEQTVNLWKDATDRDAVSALIHESQTAHLAKEGKAALDHVEPGDDDTGKNRKFTLVQIVEYCKDCVKWADVAPIVAMLNKLVRGTATSEDSELIDSAENMFKKHNKGNTITVNDSLSSPEAMKYWKKLETKGFVDHDCHLMPGVSRMEAMYIARLFSEKLNLEKKWKPFEELWGIKNMAQDNYKKDAYNATVGRERDIDEVFED